MKDIYIKPKADVVPLNMSSDIAAGIYGGGSGSTDDLFAKHYNIFEEVEEDYPDLWSDEIWKDGLWDDEDLIY